MRNAFCQSLVAHANSREFVFLTGDLGYRALEPLREAMGTRFINAGIACESAERSYVDFRPEWL